MSPIFIFVPMDARIHPSYSRGLKEYKKMAPLYERGRRDDGRDDHSILPPGFIGSSRNILVFFPFPWLTRCQIERK